MHRILPHWFRGLLVLLSILILTSVFLPLIILVAILRLLTPGTRNRQRFAEVTRGITGLLLGLCNRLTTMINGISWEITGRTNLEANQRYIIVCNHQSSADRWVLHTVFAKKIPLVAYIVNDSTVRIPVIGLILWALEFPSLKRLDKVAQDTTANTLCYFPEGKRFNRKAHKNEHSIYKYLLNPRSTSLTAVASKYVRKHQDIRILDVTIHYPSAIEPCLWDYFSGRLQTIQAVVEMPITPAHPEDYDEWLEERWCKKDDLLSELNRAIPLAPGNCKTV
ncbi:phospholipid/glycerol acyltransferase [Oleiphilus messinensis]|uniref:Phospholipid/glycerol acyltransferase n=1 Tax=Oleiphilus messinensis TaxID=141451 RepID=A0A1Y0I666_9GAMM|nr:1-acyl-sn-glycerol-3-phosphate acyltransferase [Oleiphilus messinensis]ARU55987.1 phospholipid/glycerol acyltransferase [Oleiphilus messinensis]